MKKSTRKVVVKMVVAVVMLIVQAIDKWAAKQ